MVIPILAKEKPLKADLGSLLQSDQVAALPREPVTPHPTPFRLRPFVLASESALSAGIGRTRRFLASQCVVGVGKNRGGHNVRVPNRISRLCRDRRWMLCPVRLLGS